MAKNNGPRLYSSILILIVILTIPCLAGVGHAYEWTIHEVAETYNLTHTAQVLDGYGFPHLAFVTDDNENNTSTLQYATYNGASWEVEVLYDGPGIGYFGSPAIVLSEDFPMIFYGNMAFYKTQSWQFYYFTSYSPGYVTADSEPGKIHLAYITEDGLVYNCLSCPPPQETVVDPDAFLYNYNEFCSITVADGVPHISYHQTDDTFLSQVKHAYLSPQGWMIETVSWTSNYIESGLRTDPDGGLHVLYADRYAYQNELMEWNELPVPWGWIIPSFYMDYPGHVTLLNSNTLNYYDFFSMWPSLTTEIFYEPESWSEWAHTCNYSLAGPPPHAVFSTESREGGSYSGRVKYAFPYALIDLSLSSYPEGMGEFEVSSYNFADHVYSSPTTISWKQDSEYTILAVPPEGYVFDHWTVSPPLSWPGEEFQNPIWITVGAPMDMVANFVPDNQAPVLDPIGDKSVDEGQTLNFNVTGSDPESPVTFGASGLPDSQCFDTASGNFSWTPDYDQAGIYTGIRFWVTDGQYEDDEYITITVNDVNRPPVLDPIGDKFVDPYDSLTFNISGSDPDEDDLTFSHGDLPEEATFDDSILTFDWTPDCDDEGSHQVSFTLSDGSLEDNEVVTITVTEDKDGDGVAGCSDVCPEEDATGFDADEDGCIDTIDGLMGVVLGLPDDVLSPEVESGLAAKVDNALKSEDKENIQAAINQLEAFINQVAAQQGKKISYDAAQMLIDYAESVISSLQQLL